MAALAVYKRSLCNLSTSPLTELRTYISAERKKPCRSCHLEQEQGCEQSRGLLHSFIHHLAQCGNLLFFFHEWQNILVVLETCFGAPTRLFVCLKSSQILFVLSCLFSYCKPIFCWDEAKLKFSVELHALWGVNSQARAGEVCFPPWRVPCKAEQAWRGRRSTRADRWWIGILSLWASHSVFPSTSHRVRSPKLFAPSGRVRWQQQQQYEPTLHLHLRIPPFCSPGNLAGDPARHNSAAEGRLADPSLQKGKHTRRKTFLLSSPPERARTRTLCFAAWTGRNHHHSWFISLRAALRTCVKLPSSDPRKEG